MLPGRIGRSPPNSSSPSSSIIAACHPAADLASNPEPDAGGGAGADPQSGAEKGGASESQLSAQEAAIRDREATKIAALRRKIAEQDAKAQLQEVDRYAKRRRAEEEKEEKKREAETKKSSVAGRAGKWAVGISKDIAAGKQDLRTENKKQKEIKMARRSHW